MTEDSDASWHIGWTVVAYVVGTLLAIMLIKVIG